MTEVINFDDLADQAAKNFRTSEGFYYIEDVGEDRPVPYLLTDAIVDAMLDSNLSLTPCREFYTTRQLIGSLAAGRVRGYRKIEKERLNTAYSTKPVDQQG